MKYLILISAVLLFASSIRAAVYQWSVPMDQPAALNPPRAYLWIPPNCRQVRAVVVGQHNMLEEDILEHPVFRNAMADLNIAIIWITPAFDGPFDPARSGDRFNKLMKDLADQSGYQELEFAPIVPIGHSAAASYPWNFAAWAPQRTLAVLSIHGDAPETPLAGFGKPNAPWGDRNIDGVPGLMVMGEYEWVEARLAPAIVYRTAHPKAPVAVLAEPASGHFNAQPSLISFLAMFIRKSMEQRLPTLADTPIDKPPTLNAIDPAKGWLVQRWTLNKARTVPPAPADQYTGDKSEAFWAYDEEMALATQKYGEEQIGKKPQLLTLDQDGPLIPKTSSLAMVTVPFKPLEDGITFKLKGDFLDMVPAFPENRGNDVVANNNCVRWTGLPAGSALGHADTTKSGPIQFERIEGPIEKVSPDTFRVSLERESANGTGAVWIYAWHPGDERYKRCIQQATINFRRNIDGADNVITFPEIPEQKDGTESLDLAATSSSGMPVRYYVESGPAEVVYNAQTGTPSLKFLLIPSRAKYPVKVVVVAWQWGRGGEAPVRTATNVRRTFDIVK